MKSAIYLIMLSSLAAMGHTETARSDSVDDVIQNLSQPYQPPPAQPSGPTVENPGPLAPNSSPYEDVEIEPPEPAEAPEEEMEAY